MSPHRGGPGSPPDAGRPAGGGAPRQGPVLFVVFATILIDFLGFSVLIPVLPLFADRLGASAVEVGLILSLYALAQLVFLPVWGWISDRRGRRPVLLLSLAGTAASFVMLGLADGLATIYVARILAGAFAGSVGTAQAVVTDVTPARERASGMGVLGAAFGIGMVLGPMLGGLLAAIHPILPFPVVAVLATANLGLAWARLPETRPPGLARPPRAELLRSFVPAPLRLVLAVHDRRIGTYLLLFLVVFTAFAVVEGLVTLYLGRRFGADELDAALVFAWLGAVLALTQGVLLRRIVHLAREETLVEAGFALMAVGIAAVAFVPSMAWLYAVGPVIAVGNGIALPAFTSLFSKACRAEQAGELLGQSQSMATTGRIAGPIAAGALMDPAHLGAPFLAAGALLVGALVLFAATRRLLVGGEEP